MSDTPKNLPNTGDYEQNFSEEGFWDKVTGYAKSAGTEVIMHGLKLYYSLENSETPIWAKGVVVGALGYFIFPIDVVPDLIPVVGYTDDLGVLAAAVASVHMYINDEVVSKAKAKFEQIFG